VLEAHIIARQVYNIQLYHYVHVNTSLLLFLSTAHHSQCTSMLLLHNGHAIACLTVFWSYVQRGNASITLVIILDAAAVYQRYV
jgi:hypothetical protein